MKNEKIYKTYVLTRYYRIDATSLKEAKQEIRNQENDMDYFENEEWGKTK